MISGIKLEDGEHGRRAVITSPWSEETTQFLISEKIADLELNCTKGWKGSDLSFLAALPDLRWFKILDFTISSVEPIHFLHNLRGLEVMTYCETELRFNEFPLLEDCGLEWRPKAASLFGCTTLKKLFVNRYKGADTDPFAALSELESLAILNAPIRNLGGLSALKKLRSLRLANLSRLTSLAGIEGLTKLEELDINTCRGFTSIEEIGYLPRLRKLHLNNDGKIDSLRPLDKLGRLESVLFYESTDIADGDQSPLLRQKHLANVSFMNRRHYTHSRETFPQYRTRSVKSVVGDQTERYLTAIKEALLNEWDPIGVKDVPQAQEEYDSYAPHIYALLITRCPQDELCDYLWRIETERMGLTGDRKATEQFAERLLRIPREMGDS